ncbi:MAG: hypothetical protein V1889_02880 [archaeon]
MKNKTLLWILYGLVNLLGFYAGYQFAIVVYEIIKGARGFFVVGQLTGVALMIWLFIYLRNLIKRELKK